MKRLLRNGSVKLMVFFLTKVTPRHSPTFENFPVEWNVQLSSDLIKTFKLTAPNWCKIGFRLQ
jgi:hypothetical protein